MLHINPADTAFLLCDNGQSDNPGRFDYIVLPIAPLATCDDSAVLARLRLFRRYHNLPDHIGGVSVYYCGDHIHLAQMLAAMPL